MKLKNGLVFSFALLFLIPTISHATIECQSVYKIVGKSAHGPKFRSNSTLWLSEHSVVSSRKIMENISPADGLPGAIIAARTRGNPDYYFHWIRDAALVVESLLGRRSLSNDLSEINSIDQKISEYVAFSGQIQKLPTPSGLGEPKVNVNGTVFSDPWGRPQNDSPALRAVSMIHIAKLSKKSEVNSIIKTDLDFVAEHWRDPSFDLWEEVFGTHFYTLMVQRKSMIEGAEFAKAIGDFTSEKKYRDQKSLIEKVLLDNFWNVEGSYIQTTINQVGGLTGKDSNLDIAVVLGLLHGAVNDGVFKFSDTRFLNTLHSLESRFQDLYAINKKKEIPGTAIGRYIEDLFSGPDRSGGNPWVLATLAMAEAYYNVAAELKIQGRSDWKSFIEKGDTFIQRVQYHANPDGSLNEQIQRDTGFMTSVSDLTWSHAAVLTANQARKKAME